jgi:myo-inositol-1(or 4)-monophosphatase
MKSTIHRALQEAGKILLANFGKISNYAVKENQSNIVTQIDINSEKKIFEIITKRFPTHNLLGEETGFQNNNSEFTWVADPIDGTSNYTAGIPWFGIIICVLKNNIPFMTGCLLPFQKQLYFAEKGKGATLNEKKIRVSKEKKLKNVLLSYSLDYSDEPGKTERESIIIQNLVKNIRNLRATNCIVDFCYTADGKLGASVNQTTKIWDIAGPALLIEEAGGKVSDINDHSLNFSVNESNYNRNFEFVAANKSLHSQVIKLINQ